VIRSKCQDGKDDPRGGVQKILGGQLLAPMLTLGSAVNWLMNYAVTKVNQRDK